MSQPPTPPPIPAADSTPADSVDASSGPAGPAAQSGPGRPPAATAPPGGSTLAAHRVFFSALVALGLWILWSFLPALAWAAVLAIAVEPMVKRLERRFGPGHELAIAALISFVFVLVLVVPLLFGVTEAAREAAQLRHALRALEHDGLPVPDWIARLPGIGVWLAQWWQAHLGSPGFTGEALRHLDPGEWLAHTRTIGADVIHRLTILAFTALALFLLLSHRRAVVEQLRFAACRLLGEAANRIGDQAIASVRGTIDGLVLVGIGEGVVMTVVYLLLGVPHPMLLGAVTAVAAIIPFGAAVAFCLAGLLLAASGSVGGAIAVVVIGLIVVAIADHLVRPALIGGATRLPFLWVLLGILGGVERLGLIGLFVGLATMAVLHLLWQELAGSGPTGRARGR